MNWRSKSVFLPVLLLAAAPLAADPYNAEVWAGTTVATDETVCAPANASTADQCQSNSAYDFDLSDWVNQPVVPDHLSVLRAAKDSDSGDNVPTSFSAGNQGMIGLDFQDDDDWVRKLKDIDDLSVMTFWETEATRLFLGVNDDGLPGLHFKQRKYEDGQTRTERNLYRSSGDDGRPIVHSQSLTYDVPDLREGYDKSQADKPESEKPRSADK